MTLCQRCSGLTSGTRKLQPGRLWWPGFFILPCASLSLFHSCDPRDCVQRLIFSERRNIFDLWRLTYAPVLTVLATMADTAERYRRQAEQCRRAADGAKSDLDKEAWTRAAEDWLKLAEKAAAQDTGRAVEDTSYEDRFPRR
jgi:hypothetical protein